MSVTKQKFAVEFNTDNSAFAEGAMAAEVARILHEIADTVSENGLVENMISRIKDINGARVGFYVLEEYDVIAAPASNPVASANKQRFRRRNQSDPTEVK